MENVGYKAGKKHTEKFVFKFFIKEDAVKAARLLTANSKSPSEHSLATNPHNYESLSIKLCHFNDDFTYQDIINGDLCLPRAHQRLL